MAAAKKKKEEQKYTGSASWSALNEQLMKCTDEKKLAAMLEAERSGKKRQQFVIRILSRISKVRGDRERAEVTQ